MLALIVALHFLLAAAAPTAARRFGPRVFYLCGIAPLVAVIWAAGRAGQVLAGEVESIRLDWVPGMGVGLDLRLDGFGLLMLLLVSGVGVLIFAFSHWYMGEGSGLGRFAAIMTVFAGAMLGIVVADNVLTLFVFWELTSITSYLLIGFEDEKGAARAAALQALMVTGAGGLALLGGFVLIAEAAGTYSLSVMLANPPAGSGVTVGLALVLLGAFTKSAQAPFHNWLPGAMAAPTPVSAYLHSAAMVMAGVYLIARLSPALAGVHGFWSPTVVAVGVATMLLGGYRALRQTDLKQLLAHGTVSQLGLMMLLVGAGDPRLMFAGVALILTHGLFKAALFMVVGVIDKRTGTRDLRHLHGLTEKMPLAFWVAVVATASMAGIPPLLGFMTKEATFEAILAATPPTVVIAIVAGSVLTFAYSARFLWGGFGRKGRTARVDPEVELEGVGVEPGGLVPPLLLDLATVGLGLTVGLTNRFVQGAASALDPLAATGELYLWHGIEPPVGLTVLTLLAGLGLFMARDRVEEMQSRFDPIVDAQKAYEWLVIRLNWLADRVTAAVQNGSLPSYLGVILVTTVALPGWVLVTRGNVTGGIIWADTPLQIGAAALVLGISLGLALTRRRFVAVLMLGAVGFGVAVLFVIHGAPDLAMTQILVETLTLVIFVLVLRHLPGRFEPVRWPTGMGIRITISLLVGVFVTTFALFAGGTRTGLSEISEAYLELAPVDAGGNNVVNVILTDFRALDTLGEIAVLSIAALGIASLVLAGRSRDDKAETDGS